MFLSNLMHGLAHPDILPPPATTTSPPTTTGLISQEFINSLHNMPSAASLAQLKAHLCMREHLNHEECDRALLPTLEHASLVHSHIHHPELDTPHDTFEQTRNAIIYISLVVVIYVMVVLWLVSANFRSNSYTPSTITRARQFFGQLFSGSFANSIDSDDGFDFGCDDSSEMEALIVVRDRKGFAECTTSLAPEDEDGEHV